MVPRFTEEELAAIWKELRGSAPGLYVPVYRAHRVDEKLGPRLAVFRSYSEIFKEDPAEKYWEKLNEIPRDAAISTLSAINLLLAFAAVDDKAHRALNTTFVREDYIRALRETAIKEGRQPDIEVVFSRAGILTNFKSLLTFPPSNEDKQLDLTLVGDLSLLCNDFVGGSYLKKEPKQVDNIHLLIEFVPVWELDNPRDVAYALTRVERMIKAYLPTNDAVVTKLRKEIGLDPAALTYDGLDIDDYIAIIFGIYGHGRGLNFEAVFRNPGEAIIDPKTFVSKTNFPQDKFERFLEARSLSGDAVLEQISEGKGWGKEAFCKAINTDQFATDTLIIKTRPLLRWSEGRTLILDFQYVSELLIYGLYWRIVDNLPDEKKREQFISLWGRVLELYLVDLLRDFYPETSGILSADVTYEGGQIDALLDFGTDVIILEFKASLLRDQTKNKRDIKVFEEEVKLKFIENQKGKPKALRQLAGTALAICKGSVRTTAKPERVYPVFVGYEPVLECLFMNEYLHGKFRPFIAENINDVIVKPLTVMSVDELEGLLPNLAEGLFTWQELLNERFDRDRVRAFSVRQAQYDLVKKKGAEIARNQFLLDGFERIFSEISRRYHGSA